MLRFNSFAVVFITVVFAFLLHAAESYSQTESPLLNDFDKKIKEDSSAKSSLKDEMNDMLLLTKKKSELEIRKAEYLMSSLEHRSKVFAWQHNASIVIFAIVMTIVISGLVLSFLHFYKDLKNPATPGGSGT